MTLQDIINKVKKEYGETYFFVEGVCNENGHEYIKFSNRDDLDYIAVVVYLNDLTE